MINRLIKMVATRQQVDDYKTKINNQSSKQICLQVSKMNTLQSFNDDTCQKVKRLSRSKNQPFDLPATYTSYH